MAAKPEVLKPFLANPKNVVVGYHAGCNDGFGAALVFWYLFGDTATYKPLRYQEEFNAEEYRGKALLLVDFSFPQSQMLALEEVTAHLLVLDHHETAEANLAGLEGCYFGKGVSGAVMAFELARSLLTQVPYSTLHFLVDYIQDRDLWTWSLESSREVNAALVLWPRGKFEIWDERLRSYTSEELYMRLRTEGHILLQQTEGLVRMAAASARFCVFEGLAAVEVNSCLFYSELGEYLGGQASVVLVWSVQRDGRYRYELRSKDPYVNAGELAKKYGGGGHKQAAGFVVGQRLELPTVSAKVPLA